MILFSYIFTAIAVTLVATAHSATVTPREGKFCSLDVHLSVVPDSSDCSRYFRCLDNKYYAMECGGTLLFNKEESYCDYKENVECEASKGFSLFWLPQKIRTNASPFILGADVKIAKKYAKKKSSKKTAKQERAMTYKMFLEKDAKTRKTKKGLWIKRS